jgi:N-acetylmuramoyl-L-alanine amidase
MLRETRMPAVQVEALGAADDGTVVRDPAFPARVATAIAAGVRRFFAD